MTSQTLIVVLVAVATFAVLALVMTRLLGGQTSREIGNANAAFASQVAAINRTLGELRQATDELERERLKTVTEVHTAATSTALAVERLSQETANLAGAMQGSQTRGQWGELSLRNLAASVGMADHVDFTEQDASAPTGRPDMTITLPGGRVVYVDAKTPWVRYQEAQNEQDPARRAELLAAHAAMVRDHMLGLARRGYHKQLPSLDYVIMYVPVESALAEALRVRPDLLEEARANGVLLAAPVSLIVILNNFHKHWDDDSKVRNVAAIVSLTDELSSRIATFVGHLAAVRAALAKTVEAFNGAAGSYNRMVVPQAERVNKLRQQDMALPELATIDEQLREFRAEGE